jgi:hypothetical protein
MKNRPQKWPWYRSSNGHMFSWQIYGWNHFFITFNCGMAEITISKWRKK